MKHLKNILYLLAVILSFGIALFLPTALVQLGTEVMAHALHFHYNEELLYGISGGIGTIVAGTAFALYARKKHYAPLTETRSPFQLRSALYYCALTVCICSILFDAISTFLFVHVFSMTADFHASAEKSGLYLCIDLLLSLLIAPVFEELLFRKGLYSLLRQRFSQIVSALLVTILFALLHGYAIQGFCSCLVAGAIFLFLYLHTGHLRYSILAHMACNFAAFLLNTLEHRDVALFGIPVQYEIEGFNMVHPILILVAALFCGFSLINTVRKQSGLRRQ